MATICVIEDEESIRDLLVDELEFLGHTVVSAENGVRGLAVIQSSVPDMIISDIHMPEMNGFEMRATLKRQHPKLAQIPFLFLSAFADQADVADGMVVGVDAYLTKPIDFALLERWIDRLI